MLRRNTGIPRPIVAFPDNDEEPCEHGLSLAMAECGFSAVSDTKPRYQTPIQSEPGLSESEDLPCKNDV
jgi:hypothetical protein